MKKYVESRFNEKRPFDVVRAEDFGEDLYEFYEPLEELIRKVSGVNITGSRPVFLIGGRGTGKTMVLKFQSLEMQLKHFVRCTFNQNKSVDRLSKGEIELFLNSKSFIGIYLHFRTTEYDSMKGEFASLFKPYLSAKIAEKIFEFLMILKFAELISQEQELQITEYFVNQVRKPDPKTVNCFADALKLIREDIIPQFETIFEMSSHYSIDEIRTDVGFPVIISKNIVFGLSDFIFTEIDFLKGKSLFILLDELEYLNEYQKSHIGKLIKDSDETSIILKVGSRYMPKTIPVGESNEVLQEPHDFRKINIMDSLNAAQGLKKQDYNKLMRKILNKRLERSEYFRERGITKIEQLFPNVSIEEEAVELVKNRKRHWEKFKTFLKRTKHEREISSIMEDLKYPKNPIIEKLNMLLYYRGKSPKEIKKMYEDYLKEEKNSYADLYRKNALNLLFQLYSDYRQRKKYIGIDIFIHLSSGIIRNAIELCNHSLNTAYNYGYEPAIDNPVDKRYQDMGTRNHAKLQYDDIARIPHNLGLEVQDFIKQIGRIFRALHLDRYLVEPEPTHFETDYSKITGRAEKVFDAALNYSYIQEKPPMDPKSLFETKKDDYLINRVFAPYFKISYRLRGRTFISASQICSLIEGDNLEKKETRKEIIRANRRKRKPKAEIQAPGTVQKKLPDLVEVNRNEAD